MPFMSGLPIHDMTYHRGSAMRDTFSGVGGLNAKAVLESVEMNNKYEEIQSHYGAIHNWYTTGTIGGGTVTPDAANYRVNFAVPGNAAAGAATVSQEMTTLDNVARSLQWRVFPDSWGATNGIAAWIGFGNGLTNPYSTDVDFIGLYHHSDDTWHCLRRNQGGSLTDNSVAAPVNTDVWSIVVNNSLIRMYKNGASVLGTTSLIPSNAMNVKASLTSAGTDTAANRYLKVVGLLYRRYVG